MKKQLWIFAGANGSGKSTIEARYVYDRILIINPDVLAAELDPKRRNDPDIILQAGRLAIQKRKQLLADGVSFGFETTLSGNAEIKMIQDAKNAGYKTNLIYIALSSPMDNIHRVSTRVIRGGHAVPNEDIVRRYYRSLENLTKVLQVIDRGYIIDNSDKDAWLCAVVKNGKLIRKVKDAPDWVNKALGGFQ